MKKILTTTLISILSFGSIWIASAQINLNSNAITFRDYYGKGQTTTHFGKLSLYGTGQSSQNVLYAKYDTTGTASNIYAVKGECTPSACYGVGGNFTGGAYGLYSAATMIGTGGNNQRYGSYCLAANGTSFNWGVYGKAVSSGGTSFGIYGFGNGTGANYGVYGQAYGGTSNYGVYCSGNGAYTGTWTQASDEKLKKDIQPITSVLDKIMKLQPVSYIYDVEKYSTMGFDTKKKFGLIAQNLESVFPELVRNDVCPVTEADSSKDAASKQIEYKGVDYIGLIPVLLSAIQEQQKQIDALTAKIK